MDRTRSSNAVFRFALKILLAAALFIAFCWVYRQLQIDKCLDNGGRWDYEKCRCVRGNTGTGS